MTRKLIEQIKDLPESEGFFLLIGERKNLLFIGAAKNIRQEVNVTLSVFKSSVRISEIAEIDFIESNGKDLIKLYAENIRRTKPICNISLDEQRLYPHFKITREEFPRLLITRKIENDDADYFGAFLPETGVRFLLDFLFRALRPRSCAIEIDGNFPVPCTQFYEKLCLAPCVENICDKKSYAEFVQFLTLFLRGENYDLESLMLKKIEAAAENLDFETAGAWRDLLLKIKNVRTEKKLQLRLDDAVDNWEIVEKDSRIFIYLVTRRGRKILGKRVFVFEKIANFLPEIFLSQILWQFYQFHAPKEIGVAKDFPNRKFLSQVLSCRENREIKIKIIKKGDEKITTERAFGRAKYEFELRKIKLPPSYKETQKELVSEFGLKFLPKRIECFDVAHLSGTNFVAAKTVWENGEFLTEENQTWFLEEKSELKMLEKGIKKSLEANIKTPDLIIIDGGKSQLKAALIASEKITPRKFAIIAAVKPPRKHNAISHFINEKDEIFVMKPNSEAMQLLVQLRDKAHELANGVHRTMRDTAYQYELAGILPDLTEKERKSLLQKFGSIKKLKETIQNDFVVLLGKEKGEKVFDILRKYNLNENLSMKSLIVPVRYDDPNGEAKDLQPLRLRNVKSL